MVFDNFTYRNFIFLTSVLVLCLQFYLFYIKLGLLSQIEGYTTLLFLSFISLALSIDRFIWIKNNKFGIIISENADAYSAPYVNENIKIFTLFSGNKVQVSQNTNEWIEISVIDGRKG